MQMPDALARVCAAVGDDAIAARQRQFGGEARNDREDIRDDGAVFRLSLIHI